MNAKAVVKIQGGRPNRKPRGGQAEDRLSDLHKNIPTQTAIVDVGDELDQSGVEDIRDITGFTSGRMDTDSGF